MLLEDLGAEVFRGLVVEKAPLATASIAQVHRARLRDGREVALKVQRPGLREQVLRDLEALSGIARFLYDRTDFGNRYAVDQLFDEFRKSMLRELDFRQEAMHLLTLSANLRDIEEIVIPQPVIGFTFGDESDAIFAVGLGVDFKLSKTFDLRITGGIGDIDGIGIGFAWIR